MPAVALTPYVASLTPSARTMAAADVAGNTAPNTSNLSIEIANGSAGTRTVTFLATGTFLGRVVTGDVVTIPAGETRIYKGFPVEIYGQTLTWTVDTITSVTTIPHL